MDKCKLMQAEKLMKKYEGIASVLTSVGPVKSGIDSPTSNSMKMGGFISSRMYTSRGVSNDQDATPRAIRKDNFDIGTVTDS